MNAKQLHANMSQNKKSKIDEPFSLSRMGGDHYYRQELTNNKARYKDTSNNFCTK